MWSRENDVSMDRTRIIWTFQSTCVSPWFWWSHFPKYYSKAGLGKITAKMIMIQNVHRSVRILCKSDGENSLPNSIQAGASGGVTHTCLLWELSWFPECYPDPAVCRLLLESAVCRVIFTSCPNHSPILQNTTESLKISNCLFWHYHLCKKSNSVFWSYFYVPTAEGLIFNAILIVY